MKYLPVTVHNSFTRARDILTQRYFKMADAENSGTEKQVSWNALKFIEKTPCTRDSLVYGIIGGLGSGAGYFLKSNHVRRSCDVAIGSFAFISLASWQVCRYLRHKEHEKIKQTVELLNKQQPEQDNSNELNQV